MRINPIYSQTHFSLLHWIMKLYKPNITVKQCAARIHRSRTVNTKLFVKFIVYWIIILYDCYFYNYMNRLFPGMQLNYVFMYSKHRAKTLLIRVIKLVWINKSSNQLIIFKLFRPTFIISLNVLDHYLIIIFVFNMWNIYINISN